MNTSVLMWIGVIGWRGESGVAVCVDDAACEVDEMGELRESKCEAVIRGPMVLVLRWCANEENDLSSSSISISLIPIQRHASCHL